MGIEQIPVAVVPGGLSGNARPLLHEVAAAVQRLLSAGEASAIDLSAQPLTPADKAWLRERLGKGQVRILLDAEGLSCFDETACPGVWWITHRNLHDAIMAEFIEIALVPELAKAVYGDIETGLEHLESAISDLS